MKPACLSMGCRWYELISRFMLLHFNSRSSATAQDSIKYGTVQCSAVQRSAVPVIERATASSIAPFVSCSCCVPCDIHAHLTTMQYNTAHIPSGTVQMAPNSRHKRGSTTTTHTREQTQTTKDRGRGRVVLFLPSCGSLSALVCVVV